MCGDGRPLRTASEGASSMLFRSFHPRRRHVILAGVCALALCAGIALFGVQAAQGTAAPADGETVRVPIIMYHGILKDASRSGAYVVTPDTFEKDLQYLKEKGYTTVVMQDLIDFVKKGRPLPEKPIVLTFDDGYYNNYLYAFPLLKQYGCKMVLSPIGRYTDQDSQTEDNHANYSNVTWPQINEMIQSGLVEIQNHSYDMHASDKSHRKGALKAAGEPIEQYRAALTEDVMKMQNRTAEMTGWTPTTFTYPFGAVSKEALPILKELGFQATLICESRTNLLNRDPDCLYGLGRYLRPSGPDSASYFTKTVKLP